MSEPLVLINLFSMPAELVDGFVAKWEQNIAKAGEVKGFRGTRLHRSVDPDARYPIVNIARWDSVEDWQAMFDEHFSAPEGGGPMSISADPNLYEVVHVTPDPQES